MSGIINFLKGLFGMKALNEGYIGLCSFESHDGDFFDSISGSAKSMKKAATKVAAVPKRAADVPLSQMLRRN